VQKFETIAASMILFFNSNFPILIGSKSFPALPIVFPLRISIYYQIFMRQCLFPQDSTNPIQARPFDESAITWLLLGSPLQERDSKRYKMISFIESRA
jgi:hypothetical protein